MVYYTISESVKELAALEISARSLYDLVREIEEHTPHRFGRMFRGRYFMGNPRKEKVISARDLELVKQTLEYIGMCEMKKLEAIHKVFEPINFLSE